MMPLRQRRSDDGAPDTADRQRVLAEAEERVVELEQRAMRTVRTIVKRAERNHWTETIQRIVKGDS